MAADETPAQPTAHVHECACNRNWGGPCGPCVCETPAEAVTACPDPSRHQAPAVIADPDARPAAGAGRAGEALDLDAIRAHFAAYRESHDYPGAFACCPAHRSAEDVPALLAELAEVTRQRDDWKSRTHDAWDKADRDTAERITLTNERDEARGENARIHVALSHRGLRWVPDEWRVESVGDDGSGT